jgi:hypothetical protein
MSTRDYCILVKDISEVNDRCLYFSYPFFVAVDSGNPDSQHLVVNGTYTFLPFGVLRQIAEQSNPERAIRILENLKASVLGEIDPREIPKERLVEVLKTSFDEFQKE